MNLDDLPRPIARARGSLEERFEGAAEAVAFAPGRIELVATDRRSLSFPIDHGVAVAGRRSPDEATRLHSNQRGEGFEGAHDDPGPDWVRAALSRIDREAGAFEAVYAADLPIGWGLGSDRAHAEATELLVEALAGRLEPSLEPPVSEGSGLVFVVLPTGLPPGAALNRVTVDESTFETALDAVGAGDAVGLGRMLEEVYVLPEGPIARLAALARAEASCLGVLAVGDDRARSVVALVRPDDAAGFRRRVKTAYRRETGRGEGRALVVGAGLSVQRALS